MSPISDKTVYSFRKPDCSEKENICYDALEELSIPYERVSHEHISTMEGLFEVNEALGANICKNLFLCNAQKTDFYLVLTKEKNGKILLAYPAKITELHF